MTGAGRCGGTDEVRVARAALHMWEEPCISGKSGSGAVFFVGCPLGCPFCQNREIALLRQSSRTGGGADSAGGSGDVGSGVSHAGGSGAGYAGSSGASDPQIDGSREDDLPGRVVSVTRLAEIFCELQAEGANNINLVTPTHFIPQIVCAVHTARERGLYVPVVYNTAAIETPRSVRMLDGSVDIFLPDLKYVSSELSGRYARMPDYFDAASRAIDEMVSISGEPVFAETEEGALMIRGTIVRHLVLPGHTEDSKRVLAYLHTTYGDSIYISIMSQYTPMPGIEKRYPELARRVTRREYEKVVDYALSIGIENAFIQERGVARESFIPAFDGKGV